MTLSEAMDQLNKPVELYDEDTEEQRLIILQRADGVVDGHWYFVIPDSNKAQFVYIYADIGSRKILYWINRMTPQPLYQLHRDYRNNNNWQIMTRQQLFLFNGGTPEEYKEALRLANATESELANV